jgi:hypothetical protein
VLTQLLAAPSRAQACGEQVPNSGSGGSTTPTVPTPTVPAVPPVTTPTAASVALPKLQALK